MSGSRSIKRQLQSFLGQQAMALSLSEKCADKSPSVKKALHFLFFVVVDVSFSHSLGIGPATSLSSSKSKMLQMSPPSSPPLSLKLDMFVLSSEVRVLVFLDLK
jgi:hypothetical protein